MHEALPPPYGRRLVLHRGGKGFGEAKKPSSPPPPVSELFASDEDKRWKFEPAVTEEWEAWLAAQKEEASFKGGNLYLQVGWAVLICSLGLRYKEETGDIRC